jgi:hypothetical protein
VEEETRGANETETHIPALVNISVYTNNVSEFVLFSFTANIQFTVLKNEKYAFKRATCRALQLPSPGYVWQLQCLPKRPLIFNTGHGSSPKA